jgi:ribosome-binding factor A
VVTAGDDLYIDLPPSDAQEDWAVLFTLMETTQTPQISPDAGTYFNSVSISLSSVTPEAAIYYTTNGADPGREGRLYSTPFELTSNTTVKARAIAQGFIQSEVASASYVINKKPQAAEPYINPSSGTYSGSATVTLSTDTSGATIYYTIDGTDPDRNSLLYVTAIELTSDTTVKARVYMAGYIPSSIASADFDIITQPADGPENPPGEPVVDPANDPPQNPPPAVQSTGGGGGGGCFISALQ